MPAAVVHAAPELGGAAVDSSSPELGGDPRETPSTQPSAEPSEAPSTDPSSEPTEEPSPTPEAGAPAAATAASGAVPAAAKKAIDATAKKHASQLGRASTPIRCGIKDGGCYRTFAKGSIHWSKATGAQPTWGAIRSTWKNTKWERGRLGYPVMAQKCGLPGGGCYQTFQKGSIHWTKATGAQATWGAIRSEWKRTGWERGVLGYPTTMEKCGLRGGGCYQHFQRGSIHWSPKTGAHATWGTVRSTWQKNSWERGKYGYPTGRASVGNDGKVRQRFQGGTITTGVVSTGLPHGITADGGRQLVIAHSASRSSKTGTAELWELRADARWHRKQTFTGARFGYRGLATAAAKREGDGKTPMGQYRIPFAFGTAAKPSGTKIEYRRVDRNDQWCTRSGSRHYNRWMSAPNANCTAKQAEVLSKYAQYRYGAVVDYNSRQQANRGSAIFVHVHGRGSTAGCVSVTAGQMQTMLSWLRPEQNPRIVIAPRSELKNQ